MFVIERFVGIGCYVVALLCCCHFVKKNAQHEKSEKDSEYISSDSCYHGVFLCSLYNDGSV